jgi:ribosomal protein S18 acetylase RimI-like enzyme
MLRIRELEPADAGLLGEMLYAALYWDPAAERLPTEAVLGHPRVTIFHEGWGRPGDVGLVAELDDVAVGVAWYRLFTDAEHGEGFVDEATPELAIAVVPSKRGHGIGDELLKALLEKAQAAGYRRISLSVEPGNPARKLYERHGFEVVAEGEDAWTMVASLESSPTSEELRDGM